MAPARPPRVRSALPAPCASADAEVQSVVVRRLATGSVRTTGPSHTGPLTDCAGAIGSCPQNRGTRTSDDRTPLKSAAGARRVRPRCGQPLLAAARCRGVLREAQRANVRGLRGAPSGRRPCDLYHSALQVDVPAGRFVIEQTPVPDLSGERRGVVAEGAVGSRWAGRLRIFRYEIRLWAGRTDPGRRRGRG
jgi:hypothetical protein